MLGSILGLSLSCNRTDDLAVIELNSKPVIEAKSFSQSTYVVTENNLDEVLAKVDFQKAGYTQNTSVESYLEIALAGTDFASPISLGNTYSSSIEILYSQINNALLQLGVTSAIATDVQLRIRSGVKSRTGQQLLYPTFSDPITLNVKPYIKGPIYNYQDLFLVGDATAAEWNNSADNINMLPLLKSSNSNIYTFTGYFKAGSFKIIKEKGNWDKQFGFRSNGVLAEDDGGAGNIPITTAGYYKLTIDTQALTYTLQSIATPTTSYNTVGIIGSATADGWNRSTAMTQSSFDPHLWILSSVTLNSGDLKFRANDSWDVNWGKASEFFGTATLGGDNIPNKTSWKYNIYFNDATGDYSIIPAE